MPFPFSFSLHVPGLINPFSSRTLPHQITPHVTTPSTNRPQLPVPPNRRRLSASPSSSITIVQSQSKKRGWAPSGAEASEAATIAASTSGYLDTPAKYRDMAAQQDERDEMIADLPPAKRRRGLTGSIISTAFSAALIGTAVGLTVYRLWRDRGKDTDALPPPPYQEEWVEARITETPPPKATPATPRSRRVRPTSTVARRAIGRHRKTQTRSQGMAPSTELSPFFSPTQARSDLQSPSADAREEPELEEQMDWIGDKLARLIEEGKKALIKEVVVKSDAPEDEVDDGDSGWMEEEDPNVPGPSTFCDVRRVRPSRPIHTPPLASGGFVTVLPAPSPRTKRFRSNTDALAGSLPGRTGWAAASFPSTPVGNPNRGVSVEPDVASLHGSPRETVSDWQSPEIRASMERARAALLQRRAALGSPFPG